MDELYWLYLYVNDDVPQSVYVCVCDESIHGTDWKLEEEKTCLLFSLSESIENGIWGTFLPVGFLPSELLGLHKCQQTKRKANFNETRLLYLHRYIWRKKTYAVGKTLGENEFLFVSVLFSQAKSVVVLR